MRYIILVLLIPLFLSCSFHIKIVPLSPFSVVKEFKAIRDSNVIELYKKNYFLVENFSFDNKNHEQDITNFAFYNLDTNYSQYGTYRMIFYKSSSRTNRNYVDIPSDVIEWHFDDIIFDFCWYDGKFSFVNKQRNGKILN